MIKALLIDLDGVLRVWPQAHVPYADQMPELSAEVVGQVAFAPELLLPAITGRISDEDWRAAIVHTLGKQFPHVNAAHAVRVWSTPCGMIDPEVLALVQACQRNVPVVLLTNATSRLPDDLERLSIATAFDHIINSAVVGFCKPDPAIFAAALEMLDLSASTVFYVDDSPGHVAAASQLGIVGHVYQGVALLRQALLTYGLI